MKSICIDKPRRFSNDGAIRGLLARMRRVCASLEPLVLSNKILDISILRLANPETARVHLLLADFDKATLAGIYAFDRFARLSTRIARGPARAFDLSLVASPAAAIWWVNGVRLAP
jgi:hypothetical protein